MLWLGLILIVVGTCLYFLAGVLPTGGNTRTMHVLRKMHLAEADEGYYVRQRKTVGVGTAVVGLVLTISSLL